MRVFPHLHPFLVLTKMEQRNVPPYMHTARERRENEGKGRGERRENEGKGRICGALTMMWASISPDRT